MEGTPVSLPEEVQEIYDWTIEVLKGELAASVGARDALARVKPRRLIRKLKISEDKMLLLAQQHIDDAMGKMELLNRLALFYLTGEEELIELAEAGIRILCGIYATRDGYKPSWRLE
jgi:uncharacterized protein with ACT and thioredoxin-like domain